MSTYQPHPEIDTLPNMSFPVYSSGNFGEVAPERLSVMSWSLVGESVERANRRMVSRWWPNATWHTGSRFVFVGYFNCRPYHNLSAYCYLAEQIPGLSPEAVSTAYFEDAPVPRRPRRRGSTRIEKLLSARRQVADIVGMRGEIMELDGRVTILERQVRELSQSGRTLAIGEAWRTARDLIDEIWFQHYSVTMSLVPLGSLQRSIGERVTERWAEIEPWVNAPDELVWSSLALTAEAGGGVDRGRFLSRSFYEIADEMKPWSGFAKRVTTESTGSQSREGPGIADKIWELEPRARMVGLPSVARLLNNMMSCREETKSLSMRCLHVCRILAPLVGEANGIADDDWPYLTASEVADCVASSDELSRLAERRRTACEEALFFDTPEVLDTSAEHLDATVPDRRARGVSPGIVVGRLVSPENVNPAADHAQILFCESADADLQPLLSSIAGVITARGSALSHLAILMREAGVPAVVGADLSAFTTGDEASIDGSTGEVVLISQTPQQVAGLE